MTESTSDLLSVIDASISLLGTLNSSISALRRAADSSEDNASTIKHFDNDVAALRDEIGRLNAKGIINEDAGAKIVDPVASTVASIVSAKDRPTEILRSSVDTLKSALSRWPQEDVRVRDARNEVASAEESLEQKRRHEYQLPAQLDAEIRQVQDRADQKRRADPRDREAERAAELAADELPLASAAISSAESEVRRAEAHQESTRRDVRDAEAELERARRSGPGDEQVEYLSRQLNEHQQQAARAEEAVTTANRWLQEAHGTLEQAYRNVESTRQAVDEAFERNKAQLERDALRLEKEAADLKESRAQKSTLRVDNDNRPNASLRTQNRVLMIVSTKPCGRGTIPRGTPRTARTCKRSETLQKTRPVFGLRAPRSRRAAGP